MLSHAPAAVHDKHCLSVTVIYVARPSLANTEGGVYVFPSSNGEEMDSNGGTYLLHLYQRTQ